MRTALIAMILVIGAPSAQAKDPIYTGTFSSTALGGYDAVAYFEEGKPVEGSKSHQTEWMGANWRFSNAQRLARFEADPAAFAPAYGGYCAWAVANGYTASSDPHAWKIVDDRLYLNYSKSVLSKWERDIPGFIRKADQNWPELRDDP